MDEGYNPSYGARPLRRAITRLLEDSMAEQVRPAAPACCLSRSTPRLALPLAAWAAAAACKAHAADLRALSLQMLRGDIKDGDSVIIDVGSDGEVTVVRPLLMVSRFVCELRACCSLRVPACSSTESASPPRGWTPCRLASHRAAACGTGGAFVC